MSSKIIGLGIDIVFVPRISQLVSRWDSKFLQRAFHPQEIQYFHKLKDANAKKYNWLASRWAVKEALYKAIGGKQRIPFPEMRIVHTDSGQPTLIAEGQVKKALDDKGVKEVLVSISHDKDYAIAQVLMQG